MIRTKHAAADVHEVAHRHPANRALHAVGVAVIACSGIAGFPRPSDAQPRQIRRMNGLLQTDSVPASHRPSVAHD